FERLLQFKEPLTSLNSIEWIQLNKFLNVLEKDYDYMLENWGKNMSLKFKVSENVDFLQTYIDETKDYNGFRNMYYYRVFFYDINPEKEVKADKYKKEIYDLCNTY